MSVSTDNHWTQSIQTSVAQPVRVGTLVIGGFAATFLAWAFLVPISGAVTVQGTIVSTGQNKVIAHTAGGTVRSIGVREGDHVEAGHILVTLDPTVDQATLDRLESRRFALLAQEARLEAERAQVPSLTFPQELLDAARSGSSLAEEVGKMLTSQRNEFDFSTRRFGADLDILRRQIDSLNRDMAGFRARYSAKKVQITSLTGQVAAMREAQKKGYMARNLFLDTERRLDEMQGEMQALESQIDSTGFKIAETERRIQQVTAARFEKGSNDLNRIRSDLAELTNQIRGARHVAEMTELRAPVAGTVSKLTAHTQGGVVKPGETILELVPDNAPLLAEARIAPEDIDNVRAGQKADMFVTAFNRRLSTPFAGTVSYVSADSFTDPQRGIQYFIGRVNLDTAATAGNRVQDIRPGMTAEIYITTGSHTFVSYLFKPITESFRRAFRER